MINFPKTQNLIESMVTERVIPGVNYAFLKDDQVFKSTLGFASIYPKVTQLSPFAVYDMASCTKVLATTAVLMLLYEKKKLNFKEPLQKFVPEFKDKRVKLYHLLTHTSGIRGWIPNRDQLSGQDLMRAIVNLPVTDEFEHVVRYADTNFVLLGLVIERIFNKPVQEVAQDLIFSPSGLKNTTFNPSATDCVPTELINDHVLKGIVHDPKARQLRGRCGSAGLFSNIDDLIKMGQGYAGIDSSVLPLSQATIEELYKVRTKSPLQERAWGWNLVFDPYEKYPIIYHTGFTGTLIIFDRKKKSGLILLTNRVHPSQHNQIFLTMRSRIINSFLVENKY